jgi:hypothetical protein
MRATLATAGAAFLLASTAYVLPAHAQPAPPSAQTQPYGATSQTQPYSGMGQLQTQPYQATTYGATNQVQPQPYTGMGQTQTQPYQGTTQTQPSGMAGQLPQGSYASSCKDARMDGQTLIAFCHKPDGTWQTAALRTSQCAGDIQNVNGNLTCGTATR